MPFLFLFLWGNSIKAESPKDERKWIEIEVKHGWFKWKAMENCCQLEAGQNGTQ